MIPVDKLTSFFAGIAITSHKTSSKLTPYRHHLPMNQMIKPSQQ